jgi:hypothetical protein
MDDDKGIFGHYHARLVLERRGRTLDEVEETFAARLDMVAVLDVVGRPEAFSGRVVSLVEQCIECFEDERLVALFELRRHIVLPSAMSGHVNASSAAHFRCAFRNSMVCVVAPGGACLQRVLISMSSFMAVPQSSTPIWMASTRSG